MEKEMWLGEALKETGKATCKSWANHRYLKLGTGNLLVNQNDCNWSCSNILRKIWIPYYDNEDWNLESEGFEIKPYYQLYQHKHIKKCRDLILKDGNEEILSNSSDDSYFINGYKKGINFMQHKSKERFGNL